MQYLTPSELRKIAPATQKMPPKSDEDGALIDTREFLRYIEDMGFHPIFAAQGTPHSDVDAPLKGRHLAVSANRAGFCLAILNSHTIAKRSWLGAGFSFGSTFILGSVVPVQRWKGFEEPLNTLLAHRDSLQEAKTALYEWKLTTHLYRRLAKQIASTAYLRNHRRPSYKSLMVDGVGNSLTAMLAAMERMQQGGLEPEPVDSFKPARKLKPIIGPDPLVNAANAVFQAGIAGLSKYQGKHFVFPAYKQLR